MKLQTFIAPFILGLGIATACGKSTGGDDDVGTGGTGGSGGAGGMGGTQSGAWQACDLNSDCVLTPASCCAVCGAPRLGDVDAVNRERLDQHFADVCPNPGPCPKCGVATNPELLATCDDSACRALDIREQEASACSTNADCRLRVTGCCECGGSTASSDLIAIRSDAESAYRALVCDPEQACAECAPVYPTDVEAYCATDGHCATRAAATAPFPCGTAVPVLDPTTGLEQCSRGYRRRVGPARCPSSVPRATPIPAYNAALDGCEYDADCPAATYGPYAHCGTRPDGFARACVEGCKLDADCDPGNVCLCGDPVGRCVLAGCSTGDDCDPGFDCASFEASPGCFSTRFACQSLADACAADGDCAGFSPNPAFCVFANGARACSTAQCTTP